MLENGSLLKKWLRCLHTKQVKGKAIISR